MAKIQIASDGIMKYYIGIDGGGTKTAFGCFDEVGNCITSLTKASCHMLQVKEEKAIEILKEGILEIMQRIGKEHTYVICAGLAGYGKDDKLRQRIEKVCAKSFMDIPYIICNDGEIALAGALDGQDGILVIAGTGSIALAKSQDTWYRCGGWGYRLGDEGSAYWIGKALLQEFTKQCDGRHPKTLLMKEVMRICNISDPYEIISYFAQPEHDKREVIAQLAKIVSDLAKQQDVAALHIYEQAGVEMAAMIQTLAHHFPQDCKFSYAGGLWNAGSLIKDAIIKCLPSSIHLQDPLYDPLYGAYVMAIEYDRASFKKV